MSKANTKQSKFENSEERIVPVYTKVFSTTRPETYEEKEKKLKRELKGLNKEQREEFLAKKKTKDNLRYTADCYKIKLYKIANNSFGFKNEGDRSTILDEFTKKFDSGWPWKNNQEAISEFGSELADTARALSRRVVDVHKARFRGDKTNVGTLS